MDYQAVLKLIMAVSWMKKQPLMIFNELCQPARTEKADH